MVAQFRQEDRITGAHVLVEVEFLDLITACHAFVAASGPVAQGMRDRQLSDDEKVIIHENVARVRATFSALAIERRMSQERPSSWLSSWYPRKSKKCRPSITAPDTISGRVHGWVV
ncbi:DUF6192 family protein [Streptomyces virginiae]|uniref:DUF6192 family protein n=1 Tax=Streptomyces virginiae TaxID=1961 RepID=UPI003722B0E4